MAELFWRWLLIGSLAFGGGQAALSLVERTVVADTGWVTPNELATAIAFAFITPGPVLILAPFPLIDPGITVANVYLNTATGVIIADRATSTPAATDLARAP